MLRPRHLVETERHALVVQRLANEIAALGRDVVVALAEDHDELAFDVAGAGEGVVVFALAERVRVDVGGEVADGGADAFVERAAVGEVAAEAHAWGVLAQ